MSWGNPGFPIVITVTSPIITITIVGDLPPTTRTRTLLEDGPPFPEVEGKRPEVPVRIRRFN